jgi:hypothetical protein
MRGNINTWGKIERKILWTKKEKKTLKLREKFAANVGPLFLKGEVLVFCL